MAAAVIWILTPTSTAGRADITPPPARSTALPCGMVRDVDTTGTPLPANFVAIVRSVHDLACRRDYAGLERLMTDPFLDEAGPAEPRFVVEMWHENDPDGLFLELLASATERNGTLDQGGITYRLGDARVSFSRPVGSVPPTWSGFIYECSNATQDGMEPCLPS